MKRVISIFFLLIAFCVNAMPPANETTISGTVWTTNANWGDGSAPSITGGSNIIYNINHNMTLTTTGFTLGSNSVLNICNTCTLTVNGNVTFSNGSTINLPTGGTLIINGNTTNNNNSNQIYIDGTIVINGNFTGGNGSTVTSPSGSGVMDISGSVSTTGTGSVFGSETDCTVNCDNTASDPLPITLGYFTAQQYNNFVLIEWVTLSEMNNDYFTVESSDNAIDWVVEYTIFGAGNSNHTKKYSYADYKLNTYYRLKQTDFDGKFTYSEIIVVNYSQIINKEKTILVLPNPLEFNEDINVNLKGFVDTVLLVVADTYGRHYYSYTILEIQNDHIHVISQNLPSGIYLVISSSANFLDMKRIIIK